VNIKQITSGKHAFLRDLEGLAAKAKREIRQLDFHTR
jgi:hypothetical protein